MAKEEGIKVSGVVVEILPNTFFRVKLDIGQNNVVTCQLCGKMRQNNIVVTLGDKVEAELSPYDLLKGRILRRE